jgi:hypothetical protein
MEDYEVRDVMNRRTHPRIRASIYINKAAAGRSKPEGVILVKLENVGRVLARNAMIELEVPVDLNGLVAVDEPVFMERNAEGDFQMFRLTPASSELPIFPGSSLILRRKVKTHVRMGRMDGQPYNSTRHVKVNVFADEMPPIRAKLDYAPILLGWTSLNDCA